MTEPNRRLAVGREQERIARNLHQQVVPRLFGISYELCGVANLGSSPEQRQRIVRAISDLDRVIVDIRTTIFELEHPPAAVPTSRS